MPEFKKITDFPRGTIYDILCDAYSYDERNQCIWDSNWKESDDFFYDNPEIADKYGLVTCIDGEPIGFVTWDPRNRPEYVEIGHNGIREKYKRQGYGRKQLEEAIRRIKEYDGLKRIIVCTNSNLAAPKNYESVGFRLYDRKKNNAKSAYTGDYLYYEIVLGLEATGKQLASVAMALAQMPFHGFAEGERSNLEPIVQFFPGWTVDEADRLWCAAFVYYCCVKAGFEIPIRPSGCKTCHLAGCIAWEEFAMGDSEIEYHKGGEEFAVKPGDIVLYDRVFENREHDHIGIIVEMREGFILVAEGNVNNRSEIIERPVDEHIRAYIRIPDGYKYSEQRITEPD